MRIVNVSYLHPAIAPGGAQQVAMELFLAGQKAGHEAYLIAALEHSHEGVYGKPGAPIVPMQGEQRQYFYFPQFYDYPNLSVGDYRSIEFFGDFLRRLEPDVVHFHHYHRIGVEALRAARLAAPRAVIGMTFHEMMAICMADGHMVKKAAARELCHASGPIVCNKCFPEFRPEFFALRAARLKALLAECDVFTFPSEFIAERYLDWGLPAEKCIVIPNGQKNISGGFDRSRHSPKLNRFGYFGQFLDDKGLEVIFEALLLLAREKRVPPCGLVVELNGGNKQYASPAYLEKIAGYVEELKQLKSRLIEVRDHGSYDRQQLPQRMATVDWVMVPSTWWEIFGLVVSEAWMFGRPVIASSIAALKERISEGVNGVLFPPRDAAALAKLMAELAGDTARWNAMNQAIDPPWTDEDMLDAYLSVWEEFAIKSQMAVRRPASSVVASPFADTELARVIQPGGGDGVLANGKQPRTKRAKEPQRRQSGKTARSMF